VVPELTGLCACRKPQPGMLIDAARELAVDLGRSWIVGDAAADIAAGAAAGVRSILIENPASIHRRSKPSSPDATAPDLTTAAEFILGEDAR
jgi:D-glycero-D-manno-heptose 1,7-bisphosphate phosphatase